jgi:hypothetical protein|tara:strand:+ start:238 stop:567 length:330 start_codon:yes stop_codon:yes gene_type:complete
MVNAEPLPAFCATNIQILKGPTQENIVEKEIPRTSVSVIEADPNVFVFVLLGYGETAFELNLERQITAHMMRDRISTLPVIAEAKGHEAIVREDSGRFLKIVIFLLARI